MTYKIELTEDEVNMAAYALKEMGSRRQEQSIERSDASLNHEATRHFKLAARVYQALSARQPGDLEAKRTATDAVFHRHLDECEQCWEHPFALCEKGHGLLQQYVAHEQEGKR